MTKNEMRRSISPLKGEVIKYIERYFNLFYNAYDSDYRFLHKEAYRVLETDIDFHIQYYKDETINEIFLCTWSGGWGYKQSSIKIQFNWGDDLTSCCYQYNIADRTGDKPIELEYESNKKEDMFISLDKYFMSVCSDNQIRDIKLNRILNE